MTNRLTLFVLCVLIAPSLVFGQSWVDGMQDHKKNFYDVQKDFEEYWKDKEVEKGHGWKQFKRWEYFTEQRVYPSGERPNPTVLYKAQQAAQQTSTGTSPLGDWRPLGPVNGNFINGIGRLNCIAFDPNDPNILYVGAPAGGFWKSTDNGQSWMTSTDDLASLGVSAIVVDPTNTNHIFIATGDRDAADTYSAGVMESMDGGMTWSPTGFTRNIDQTLRATGLELNENNPQELVLTTRSGIFKTNDGGANWVNVQGGNFQSIHQKSGNPEILFATTYNSSRIWRSTDGGDSWSQLIPNNVGLPSNARRMELAMTPADTNYIYCLAAGSDNGFLGLWRSTNGGNTWTQRSNSPNILGWSTSGAGSGGQGWYDLAIAVAPDNREEIYTGGVNIWRSGNGGTTWSLNAHWFGGGGAPYVHADIHDLEFRPGTSTLYSCSDGGLDVTINDGGTWSELQNGMNITQYYKISTSNADSSRVLAGAQDNGTHRRQSGNTYNRVLGGDGMDNAIDNLNPQIMYGSSQYGNFSKSTNAGGNFSASFDNTNNLPMGNGGWVTPIELDPNTPSNVYIGYQGLHKSTNSGVTFTTVNSSINGNDIDLLYVPVANSNHVYVGINSQLFRSTSGGQNVNQMNTVPGAGTLTGVAVADNNDQHIWITRSGYNMGNKVYESTDGGATWTNISGSLPNLPVNCILYNDTANDGIYVGTDVGVYYRDNNLSDWLPFMSGLPNVIVNDLEYQPISDKIRAGTYGRGLWESPAYAGDLLAPIAGIAPITSPCSAGDVVQLNSQTLNMPESFKWSINPPTFSFTNGTTDTTENPQVIFNQNGWYDITLMVSNGNGSDSITEYAALRVGGLPLPYSENFDNTDSLGDWTVVNPDNVPGLGWQQVSVVGTSGSPTKAARMDLYQYAISGLTNRRDHLVSPALDFTTHQNVSMTFDHAYARRNGQSYDTLIVSASSDCGMTWTDVMVRVHGQGQGLATRANVTGPFNPANGSEWCGGTAPAGCSVVDLSAFDGMSGVLVRFTTVSNRGNRLFIDNINIDGTAATAPIADFTSSTMACANYDINFINLSAGVVDSVRWIFNGGVPATSTAMNPTVAYPNPGSYDVELRAYNSLGSDTEIKTSQVSIQANSVVDLNMQISGGLCTNSPVELYVMETNVGSNPTYEWYVNGVAVGIDDSAATFNNLVNGDLVYAEVISSETCAWPQVKQSDTLVISLNNSPTVTAGQVAPICQDQGPQYLTFGSPVGGFYSGPGVVNDTLYPSLSGSGVKILKYTYVDANGCSASANRSVQISSKPVFAFNDDEVCNTNNSYNPNWVQPSGGMYIFLGDTISTLDATVLSPGTYNASYYYQNGACDSTYQFSFDVIAGPAQPALTQSNDTLFSTLMGNSYRWFRDGLRITGANDDFYVVTQNGYYQVEIRDSNACANRSDSLMIANIGLQEVLESSFNAFPNPNNGNFRVQLPSWAQGQLRLMNTAGQEIWRNDVNGGITEYEISLELPAGVYLLRFQGADLSSSLRIVIE